MAPILEAHGLTKRFKTTEALAGLDLTAERGQVTAVLGPNGAGKTTFVRMVATLLQPDAGTLTVAGIDALAEPAKVRRAIGLAGQSAAVEGAMSGRENLELIGRLFGHEPKQAKASAQVVLERLGLTDAADRLVRTYSGGMRRKLDLGASLVGAPELLLLDEPTTGLDPRSRNELWDIIRDLVASGTDVLLTTQYLDEADQLASHIAIIDHGKVIAEGTSDQLKSLGGVDVIQVHVIDPADLDRTVAALAPLGAEPPRVDVPTRSVTVPVEDGSAQLLEAVRILDSIGVDGVRRRPAPGHARRGLPQAHRPPGGSRARRRSRRHCRRPRPQAPRPRRLSREETTMTTTTSPVAGERAPIELPRPTEAAGVRHHRLRRRPPHRAAQRPHPPGLRAGDGPGRHVPAHLPLRVRRRHRRRRDPLRRLRRARLRRHRGPVRGDDRRHRRRRGPPGRASSTGSARCPCPGWGSSAAGWWPTPPSPGSAWW